MSDWPLLTLLTLLPLAGGVGVACLPAASPGTARARALGVAVATLLLALAIAGRFDTADGGMQFGERHAWLPALGIEYRLGLDGMSLVFVLLTGLLVPLALGMGAPVADRAPLYYGLMLLLEAGLLGTFTALNFVHWFLFWELSLIPAFFLIRLWGEPGAGEASTQFFVYTMVGSVAMLLGFLGVFLAVGRLDFVELASLAARGEITARLAPPGTEGPSLTSMLVFAGVFLGLAVKIPVMPFHTWLPATYAAAPTGVAMLLTGAMSKMGVYGLLRILVPVFPDHVRALATPLLALAVLTILAAAATAAAQRDLKRLLAYSSINHLGYCLLGVLAVAVSTGDGPSAVAARDAALGGTVLQVFNHGLTAATLFGLVGWIERRSGGRRGLDDFGGLRRVAPVFAGVMGVAVFSSLGLPGLNGFVGEYLIFRGAFGLVPAAAVPSVLGLLLTAVFLLALIRRVFAGPVGPGSGGFPDLDGRERVVVAVPVALMLALGWFPQLVLGFANATLAQMAAAWRGF